MHKIIFLDIDGVLKPHLDSKIAHQCMWQLNNLLDLTQAKLVISSSWRYMVLGGSMTIEGFDNLLCTHGLQSCWNPTVLGTTCSDEDAKSREEQILGWVKSYEPTHWVALDDMSLKLENAIHVDPVIGLSGRNVADAVAILTDSLFDWKKLDSRLRVAMSTFALNETREEIDSAVAFLFLPDSSSVDITWDDGYHIDVYDARDPFLMADPVTEINVDSPQALLIAVKGLLQ
jgi:hypothetical protein